MPASNARLLNRERIHISGFKGPKLKGVMLKSGRLNYHSHRRASSLSRLFARLFAGSRSLFCEIFAVGHVHGVVLPAVDTRVHQMLGHIEVERYERLIGQHERLRTLQQLPASVEIAFVRRAFEELIVLAIGIMRQVDPESALQDL